MLFRSRRHRALGDVTPRRTRGSGRIGKAIVGNDDSLVTRCQTSLGNRPKRGHLRIAVLRPTERAGFEPAVQLLTGHVFSKDAHSTALPPLLTIERQPRAVIRNDRGRSGSGRSACPGHGRKVHWSIAFWTERGHEGTPLKEGGRPAVVRSCRECLRMFPRSSTALWRWVTSVVFAAMCAPLALPRRAAADPPAAAKIGRAHV